MDKDLHTVVDELFDKIDELKQENEQLKTCIERLKTPELKTINLDVAFENQKLKQENERLLLALQEIREELEEDITCESRECGCDDYGECLNCLKDIILTKINSVIGAE